ncbi:MAG: 50S ribosomal protein L11 methyltransferase [Bacteroidales bacterium]|nr:50S ribosomal protein L11 methyltransferase [Bacteroidales bacterium]
MNNHQPSSLFLELAFQPVPEGWSDILIAELAETGFNSFTEEEGLLLAYIPESDFNEMAVHQIVQKYPDLKDLFWSITRMPDKNWNAIWESSYEPVLIADRCYIRAPFHPASDIRHPVSVIDIIIEPKMSFGTAHHETTSLMIEALLEEDVTDQAILDMGCGTGILAILASKMGAKRILAVDFDERAVENSMENVMKNNTGNVDVKLGDDPAVAGDPFDVILANINRNTLIEQIPSYAASLRAGGRMFLSGFYSEDLPAIDACAKEQGLSLSGTRMKNNWIVAKFHR